MSNNVKELYNNYIRAQANLEFTRKELVRGLKAHPRFKDADKYLDTFKFEDDGLTVKYKEWTGPDEIEYSDKFYNYDEFPTSEYPF